MNDLECWQQVSEIYDLEIQWWQTVGEIKHPDRLPRMGDIIFRNPDDFQCGSLHNHYAYWLKMIGRLP